MRTSTLLAALVLCTVTPTFAQDTPAIEISGGYSLLRDDLVEENFHGWLASIGFNLSDTIGFVGELGRNAKEFEFFDVELAEISISSFLVGPRVAARGTSPIVPYGQVLVGGIRGTGRLLGESESSTEFAVQPGGGVDFWVQPNFGVRVGGDYRRIFAEDEGVNEFRFHVGIVVGLGR